MNRRNLLLSAAALAVPALGLTLYPQLSVAEVALTTASGAELAADRSTLLVDIRQPEEWQQTGVVEGALLLTYADADSFVAAIAPHLKPGQSVTLICRSGNRSSRAARQIAGRLDVPVVDVAGGMIRVAGEGYRPVAPTAAMGCTSC